MKKRVLIVDDCPVSRVTFSQHFENLGADVDTVGDGKSALETVARSMNSGLPFSLILVDVRMPELDGIETAKLLRSAGYAGTIAACTASTTGEGRRDGIEAGVDVYLDKMVLKKPVFAALLNKS